MKKKTNRNSRLSVHQ